MPNTKEDTRTTPHEDIVQLVKDELAPVIIEAFKDVAETQRILALPYMTTHEVAKVYPIGKSTLEKMRMNRTGPKFFHVSDLSSACYKHKDVQDWLNRHAQKVM